MQIDEIKNLEDALAVIQTLKEKSAALEKENEKLKQQNHNLTELVIKNQKKMFGKSSEQLEYMDGSEQLSFFNEAEDNYAASAPEPSEKVLVEAHTRRKKRTKAEIIENLEHKEMLYDLEDKNCPECGEALVCIGKEFVRSELNIIPAQVFVVDIYRKVYKCINCADDEHTPIYKAQPPVPVMKKSMATPETVAYVMQQKYQLGLPLYRQEQYWKAEGVELKRNTLANWIMRSSLWFMPLWNRMKEILVSEDIIHADETPLRVLKHGGVPTDSQSRMWVFCSGQHSSHKMSLYFHHRAYARKASKTEVRKASS